MFVPLLRPFGHLIRGIPGHRMGPHNIGPEGRNPLELHRSLVSIDNLLQTF